LREPYKSTFEQEITTFLVNHGITNIVTNKRNIIGKELDIYLPDFNLAIEYNGEYWHHDKVPHITKHYHYDKFMLCENNNIKLFTIFGNSWQEKKNIWKEKILSSIGLASRRIYARKTKIVQISSKDTKEFLNKHHIQGYSASKYCYGLVYNDELVAVMTFSDKRVGIGKNRGEGSFELVRYATSCSVVGGASKLLTHFIKSQTPKIIYSYSDNQYSHGDLYKLLDFELEKISKCGYWYYDPVKHRSYHRYNFTKHKLVSMGYDVNKTEKQIMNELGFLRIYDCGSKTWVLKL
jgi:hypothetical protein